LDVIRKARPLDAMPLSRLAESTFREAFGHLNTVENMDAHCRASYSEAMQAAEISNPNMVVLMGWQKEDLVGFAQLCWGVAPDCVQGNTSGELMKLYVASDWHGKGVAQDLMHACIEEMKKHGSDVLWLGVWEKNPRAIAFYKKFGFAERGDHIFRLGSDPQRDIVMVRSL